MTTVAGDAVVVTSGRRRRTAHNTVEMLGPHVTAHARQVVETRRAVVDQALELLRVIDVLVSLQRLVIHDGDVAEIAALGSALLGVPVNLGVVTVEQRLLVERVRTFRALED